MAKGRVYCRDKVGREVPWGRGRAWIDFTIKDATGKSHRVRRPVSFHTKAEAEMELARLMTEKAAEFKVSAPAATFANLEVGACFDAWVESRRNREKPYSSRVAEGRVRQFVEWIGRECRLEDANSDAICGFRDFRLMVQSRKPQTVRVDLGAIGSFFRWCRSKPRRWIELDPMRDVERPPGKKGRPDALKDWDAAEKVIAEVAGHPILDPAYRLAFSTVCREEIALARWEHVDWKRGAIKIPDGKNATREAELPLHAIALDWLKENRQESGFIIQIDRSQDRHVRPWGQRLEKARQVENRERKKAGLLPLPGFHKGRHTLATALARNGVPLSICQVMLRHSNPTTTARYYIGVRPLDAAEHLKSVGGARMSEEAGSAN